MALIPSSVYFKTSRYCLGNPVKKVSEARGLWDTVQLWLGSAAGSWAPHAAVAEGPTPTGQRAAFWRHSDRPRGHGDSSFTAKHEAGVDEGAGLQEFYQWLEVMESVALHTHTYTYRIFYIYTHMCKCYILSQVWCNIGHTSGQDICESSDNFFLDTLCLLYSALFWRGHSPKIWKSSTCTRQTFNKSFLLKHWPIYCCDLRRQKWFIFPPQVWCWQYLFKFIMFD